MRAAFHSAAFKEKTDAFAKTVAAAAAGRAEDSAVAAFWHADKKPEELRAALLRAAFKTACHDGAQGSAGYLLAHYPQHLNITEIKKSAVTAITQGHDALALMLAEKIAGATERKDAARALEIISAEAFEKGGVSLTKNLLSLLPQTDSTYLYRTALGDKPANLLQVIAHCKTQQNLAQKDLDQTFVIAVKNKNMSMAQALLASGADADGCRKAALRHMAAWQEQDTAALKKFLPVLIAAGADPFMAQDVFAAPYHALIQDAALKTQNHHTQKLQAVIGQEMSIAHLRTAKMPDGMNGLHYAAKHRLLSAVSFSGLTAADLQSTQKNGATLVQIIEQSGALPVLLQPAKWQGQKDILQHFVSGLSIKTQEKTDLAALLHEVDILTLRNRARGLRLKPKGF